MSAVALYNLQDLSFGSVLASWKVFSIVFFIFMASPTATHAITKAAMIVGVEPWLKKRGARMIWQIDLLILLLVVCCAIATITVKDLLSATIIFSAYSFLMCLLWAEMGAVDVAFTEATVGAGVSTIFFIAAIFRTTRRSKD